MEAGFVIILVVLAAALGAFTGFVISASKKNDKTYGILNVDCSDPSSGTYLYLELGTSIADISDQKRVTFDVRIVQ